jgi:hypothetical protein
MTDRLNDTDPQSPAAMQSRTDPGLGGPPPVVVVGPRDPLPPQVTSPPPGDGSIDELLDGITGPRPAPSSRRKVPEGARAYAAARPAPTPQPMPAAEPLVLSLEPAPVSERDALTVPRQVEAAGSTRPVVRFREERTVISERRALVRNVVAVIFSSALFAGGLVAVLHWNEARAPRPAAGAAVVMAPLAPSPEVPATTASIVIVSPPPPETVAAPAPAPAPVASTPSASASAPSPLRASFPKRTRTVQRVAAPAGSLDDLNREISH